MVSEREMVGKAKDRIVLREFRTRERNEVCRML